jgi:uncharacterized protein
MAPEFVPFVAFLVLAIAAIAGVIVGVVLLISARGKKGRRLVSVAVLVATVAVLLVLLLMAANIRQQFFLNEPFVTACGQGDLAEAERLLARGASPNAYGIDFAQTALIAASEQGHRDIVVLLLDNGAKVGLRDIMGRTALDRAKERGHRDIVVLLEEAECGDSSAFF